MLDTRLLSASRKMIDRQRKLRLSEIVEGNWLQPRIAITFDDGPHPVMTSRLLDELKRLDVKATFFLVGKRMRFHPDLVMRMLLEGHEVGNHTVEDGSIVVPRSDVAQEVLNGLRGRLCIEFKGDAAFARLDQNARGFGAHGGNLS